MNRIIKVELTLTGNEWTVAVTKEFAPEYGGGTQEFTESGGQSMHRALDVAREMVTFSPARRSDACPWCKGSGKGTHPADAGGFSGETCSRCEGAGRI